MTSMFSSSGRVALFERGQLLKERICSFRSKFFPLRVDPTKEVKNKMAKLLPLKVYPFT